VHPAASRLYFDSVKAVSSVGKGAALRRTKAVTRELCGAGLARQTARGTLRRLQQPGAGAGRSLAPGASGTPVVGQPGVMVTNGVCVLGRDVVYCHLRRGSPCTARL